MFNSRSATIFQELFKRMQPKHRRSFYILQAASVVTALSEMLCLAVIALFISALSAPESLQSNSIFQKAKGILGGGGILEGESLILLLALAIVFASLAKNATTGLLRYGSARYAGSVSAFFQTTTLSATMRMPYPWVSRQSISDMITRTAWANSSGLFMELVINLFSDTVLLLILFASLMAMDPMKVSITLALLGILAGSILFFVKRIIDGFSQKVLENRRNLNRRAMKAICGMRDARILGKEKDCVDEYATYAYALPFFSSRLNTLQQVPGWGLEVIGLSLLCATTWGMITLSGMPTQSIMNYLVVIALAAWRGVPAVIRVLTHVSNMRKHIPQLTQVLDFLSRSDKETVINDDFDSSNKTPITFSEKIELDSIDFAYRNDDPLVLRNISFSIVKGEVVGIIGRSGAGKSTIADIIIGLQIPKKGSVKVDNTSLSETNRSKWMHQVGYVSQESFIFDGTLAQNIAFTTRNEAIDRKQIMDSCRQAAITDFLHTLPQGIDTPVGDRGARLSGGQKQRVGIARAIYSNPEILIFDEATSSLDSKNEKMIQKMILDLKGRVTMVIIAHRLTTVEGCDKIIWMGNGGIRMVGKPADVIPAYEQEATDS